jgi:hypothetical protein
MNNMAKPELRNLPSYGGGRKHDGKAYGWQ